MDAGSVDGLRIGRDSSDPGWKSPRRHLPESLKLLKTNAWNFRPGHFSEQKFATSKVAAPGAIHASGKPDPYPFSLLPNAEAPV
jgi:hypothetical protein